MKFIKSGRVLIGAIGLVVLFVSLYSVFTPANLIILLNGTFLGSMAAIVVAYKELVWLSIKGEGVYNRVQQMTLSFALCWLAIILGALSSVYIKFNDLPTTSLTAVAIARYLATVAAVLQVTAPDFGLGLFHGRDRKVMTASLSLGIAVALIVILLQT